MKVNRLVGGLRLGLLCSVGFMAPGMISLAQAAGVEQPASCTSELIVLHATNERKGIEPGLSDLSQLKKPPLSSYDTYKLLQRSRAVLVKGTPSTIRLPEGRELVVTMKDEVPASGTSTRKIVLSASIRNAAGGSTLPMLDVSASPGEIFFVAGPKYGAGVLVIGIRASN